MDCISQELIAWLVLPYHIICTYWIRFGKYSSNWRLFLQSLNFLPWITSIGLKLDIAIFPSPTIIAMCRDSCLHRICWNIIYKIRCWQNPTTNFHMHCLLSNMYILLHLSLSKGQQSQQGSKSICKNEEEAVLVTFA